MERLAVLGAPGAGKGTQAHFISQHFGIPHISTGNLLRDQMKRGTKLGNEVAHLIEAGKLVPCELVIELLEERIKQPDCADGFLLDGFPRTLSQAKVTQDIVGKLDSVISVEVPDDVIIERMSGRRICTNCGATYHNIYKPAKVHGICDACGGELKQRADDKAKTVRERLDIYHAEADPIRNFFKEEGLLLVASGVGEISEITKFIIDSLTDQQAKSMEA